MDCATVATGEGPAIVVPAMLPGGRPLALGFSPDEARKLRDSLSRCLDAQPEPSRLILPASASADPALGIGG
jgi:hypothetical protein